MTNTPLHKNQAGQPAANGGHFAAKTNDEATVALALAPVTVRVRYEAWDANDNLQELSFESFDGRALLDARGLDDIDTESNDDDDMFYAAVALGLIPEHSGPFTVVYDSDNSVSDYIEAREAAGLTEPITGKPRRTADQLRDARQALNQAEKDLELKQFKLAVEAVETLVLAEDPNAAEIQIYNAGADDGESNWQVEQVRDANGAVIFDDLETFDYGPNDYAVTLDRYLSSLYQAPDDKHPNPWYGIVIGR
jgi:hypothetical protein